MDDGLSHFADYREGPPQVKVPMLEVPAEMVLKLAIGMEEPLDIAKHHGFTEEQFHALCAWEPFMIQVKTKKAELQQGGFTFKLENAFYAQETGKKLYLAAMRDETTLPQLLEAYKTFAKLADLEPKTTTTTQAGPGFSITINLTQPKESRRETVIVEQGATAPEPVGQGSEQVPHPGRDLAILDASRPPDVQRDLPAGAG